MCRYGVQIVCSVRLSQKDLDEVYVETKKLKKRIKKGQNKEEFDFRLLSKIKKIA